MERLRGAVSCPGVLDRDTVGRVFASADLLAHSSVIEESSNAVREALAAGLPLAVSQRAGEPVRDGQTGLVVRDSSVGAWTEALGRLARDRELRESLGREAHAWAKRELPTWADVLAQDLLPVWIQAARGSR
jgi:phosphatidylinositol alpha 1,6-mannosyltransferase